MDAIRACSVFLKEDGSGLFATITMVEFGRRWYAATVQENEIKCKEKRRKSVYW